MTGIAVCAGECIVRGKVECAVHSVFADDAFQSFMSHQLRLIFAAGHAAVCRQIFLIFFTGGLKILHQCNIANVIANGEIIVRFGVVVIENISHRLSRSDIFSHFRSSPFFDGEFFVVVAVFRAICRILQIVVSTPQHDIGMISDEDIPL